MKTLSMAKGGCHTIKWMLALPYDLIETLNKIGIAVGREILVISNDGYHVLVKSNGKRYIIDNEICDYIRI